MPGSLTHSVCCRCLVHGATGKKLFSAVRVRRRVGRLYAARRRVAGMILVRRALTGSAVFVRLPRCLSTVRVAVSCVSC